MKIFNSKLKQQLFYSAKTKPMHLIYVSQATNAWIKPRYERMASLFLPICPHKRSIVTKGIYVASYVVNSYKLLYAIGNARLLVNLLPRCYVFTVFTRKNCQCQNIFIAHQFYENCLTFLRNFLNSNLWYFAILLCKWLY